MIKAKPAPRTATTPPSPPQRESPDNPAPTGAEATHAQPTITQEQNKRPLPVMEKYARPMTEKEKASRSWQLALRRLKQGQTEDALGLLQQTIEHDSGHISAREALASIYINRGQLVEAEGILNTGLKTHPKASPLARLSARLMMNQNNNAQAISTLKSAMPEISSDPSYHALLAAALAQHGETRQAADLYQRLLGIHPNHPEWWLGLALTQDTLGNNTQALAAYGQALTKPDLGHRVRDYVKQRIKALDPAKDVSPKPGNIQPVALQ